MKLEQIINWARLRATSPHSSTSEREFGKALLDLLAEDAPCGYKPPRVVGPDGDDGVPLIVLDDADGFYSPEDARAMARMLLRAADECEAKADQLGDGDPE